MNAFGIVLNELVELAIGITTRAVRRFKAFSSHEAWRGRKVERLRNVRRREKDKERATGRKSVSEGSEEARGHAPLFEFSTTL